jgi:hypothetical protein
MDSTDMNNEMNNNKNNVVVADQSKTKNTATQLADTVVFASTAPTTSLSAFADAIQKDPVMRKNISDIDDQVDALRKFEKGQLTYAEMRALCG